MWLWPPNATNEPCAHAYRSILSGPSRLAMGGTALMAVPHREGLMSVDEHAQDLIFDPFDPAQTRTSWEKLARLRRECPVSRPFESFLYTAKLDDSRDVFRDTRRFFY